jgi:hypothetical protein
MTKTPVQNLEQLISARDEAMEKVRAWWHAGLLAGQFRDHTKAPAWPEYLAAFAALDEAREVRAIGYRVSDHGLITG